MEEFYRRSKGGKYFGKVTSSLTMKDQNTIVIKVAYDYLEPGVRAVITIVAQRD